MHSARALQILTGTATAHEAPSEARAILNDGAEPLHAAGEALYDTAEIPEEARSRETCRVPKRDVPREHRRLENLLPELATIPAESVLEPRVSMAFILDQALELLEILQHEAVRLRLRSVGVSEDKLDALAVAIDVTREAQARCVRTRDAQKSTRQAEAESLAHSLREEMVAACRFHLNGVEARELLARVTDGENPHDLVQDLRELAEFIREHTEAFAEDKSFDPALVAAEAFELAAAIHLPSVSVGNAAIASVDVRDRALTHLHGLLEELRHAGRYAFRGTVQARRYFASEGILARRRHPLCSL